jgi:small subunit ribosomal protein S20
MPNIKSAIKRLKGTIKKTKSNAPVKGVMKSAIKKIQKSKDSKDLNTVIKNIDKAVKKGVIKKNAGARKKSRLAKMFSVK